MPTIEKLTERVAPTTPEASVAEVFAWFTSHPDALALPVVVDGRPVGLIDRQDFLLKLAEPLGHSRYASRPIHRMMDPEPAVVEYDVRISAFSEAVLKNTAANMLRGFIVTRQGQYFGIGTAISLLHHVNQAQTRQIDSLTSEVSELRHIGSNSPQLAQAKSEFVSMLQREFEVPFHAIQTFSHLLQQQPLSLNARQNVHSILDSVEDARNLLGNACDLVLLDSGSFELELEATPLRDLMDSIAIEWMPLAESYGVTIMSSYEGDTELAAMVDQKRFRKTFNTLIESSLRLVRNGIIEVRLKAEVIDDRVHLKGRVRDDGPGLDPEQLDKPFGDLGLAQNVSMTTAKKLLDNLGGQLWFENNTGRGATYAFDVTVPCAINEQPVAEKVAYLELTDVQRRPHVLIADDNTTNRVVAQALCEMFGCTCETVEDGLQALEAVRISAFDLILMDIKMPNMDGLQATRAIRAIPNDKGAVPIIALTANADPDDASSYVAAGMLCVVEKPIKPERLRMAMNMALAQAYENAETTRIAARL